MLAPLSQRDDARLLPFHSSPLSVCFADLIRIMVEYRPSSYFSLRGQQAVLERKAGRYEYDDRDALSVFGWAASQHAIANGREVGAVGRAHNRRQTGPSRPYDDDLTNARQL